MPPHVERMIEEKKQLDSRIEKLVAFVTTSIYDELPEAKRTLLAQQLIHMTHYAEVLQERLKLEE